jgi:hypothetical protein
MNAKLSDLTTSCCKSKRINVVYYQIPVFFVTQENIALWLNKSVAREVIKSPQTQHLFNWKGSKASSEYTCGDALMSTERVSTSTSDCVLLIDNLLGTLST